MTPEAWGLSATAIVAIPFIRGLVTYIRQLIVPLDVPESRKFLIPLLVLAIGGIVGALAHIVLTFVASIGIADLVVTGSWQEGLKLGLYAAGGASILHIFTGQRK